MEVNSTNPTIIPTKGSQPSSGGVELKTQPIERKEIPKSPTENMEKLQKEMSKEEQSENLKNLVEEMNRRIDPLNLSVKFGFSDDIEAMYVSVLEKNTDRVIRQFPSEEAIDLMKKMDEIVGMIFDQKG
ncbi:MAG: flagellar protein FlaG [Campylobacterales bacterium]